MNFEAFKKEVKRLAKLVKASHLIPSSNTLYVLWENNKTPKEVVGTIKVDVIMDAAREFFRKYDARPVLGEVRDETMGRIVPVLDELFFPVVKSGQGLPRSEVEEAMIAIINKKDGATIPDELGLTGLTNWMLLARGHRMTEAVARKFRERAIIIIGRRESKGDFERPTVNDVALEVLYGRTEMVR